MLLNRGPLNSTAINNSFEAPTTSVFSGVIAVFNQTTGVVYNGVMVHFRQDVQLLETFEGTIAEFRQSISSISEPVIPIVQKVGAHNPTWLERYGYEIDIIIDNEILPHNRIHGDFTYQKTTGQTTSVTFTLLNQAGIQNPEYYMGKPVVIRATTSDGVFNLFTGYIDTPEINLIEEKTTFSCSDRRSNRIKNLVFGSATFNGVETVGRYSTTVFGTPKDKLDELEKRLETTPYDFDFDNNGNPQLTAWLPKEIPDYTLTGTPGAYNDNKVYYTEPQVKYSLPTGRLNTVNINVSHTYSRLHQQTISVDWAGYSDFCDWFMIGERTGALGQPSFPMKTTIDSAARSGDWIVPRGINFIELWPAQGFTCDGVVIWRPNKTTEFKKPRQRFAGFLKDGAGNLIVSPDITNLSNLNATKPVAHYEDVKDIYGNVIEDVYRTEVEETSIYQCRGASWTASRKFSQNVTEQFRISMTVPSTLNQFGEVLNEEAYSITSEFNTDQWDMEKNRYINTEDNVYQDVKSSITEVNNALLTALSKAKTSLLAAHRDVKVIFDRSFWPQIDVINTVEVDIDPVKCRGRVGSITHRINFLTAEAVTTVELYLSRCPEAADDSELTITPFITDNPAYIGLEIKHINLGTHLGVDPAAATPQSNSWNGWIANRVISGTAQAGAYRTNINEQFIMDYPAIPEKLTQDRVLTVDESYTVDIPNDYLIIESNRYSE
jgi:hypothetical protein